MSIPTQRATLLAFAALTQQEPEWRGKLLLVIGMDRTLALAALAAGAATLILEDDASLLREARQDVTFTVTTLDEALRALKNEIRQGRAITVALAGNTQRWLAEIKERGVQPHRTVTPHQFLGMADHPVNVAEDHAATPQERRTRDATLMQAHPEQQRWLRAAPSLFPRDRTRAYLSEHQRLQPLP